jgi:ABC-2 type transport system ATP-binding protein
MQRKLLLCRAMLQNSPILLFDELSSGLDPNIAMEFRGLLQRLAREEKKTIFLSTHNLYEAQGICDRIAIIDRGKITACDTPDNIRYMAAEEKVFNISFIEAVYNDERAKIVSQIEHVEGVHGVTPEVGTDNSFQRISIRTSKDMDISGILDMIITNQLKIGNINSQEPTLEQAFMSITGRLRGRLQQG